jgi:hypothetical protein
VAHADQEAAAAAGLTASWQRIAATYRWLAYHQAVFGKWQPSETPAEAERDLP